MFCGEVLDALFILLALFQYPVTLKEAGRLGVNLIYRHFAV